MNTPKSIIPNGALTALVTPLLPNGEIYWGGLEKLVAFQASQGISGIVPVGTTGESSTLAEHEHNAVIRQTLKLGLGKLLVMPGCGSNNTKEAMHYVQVAAKNGAKAVLLVDCYYNGPSSLELRNEYYGPIAKAFPDVAIVPYIIPGRTGCALWPQDLAELNREFPNVCAVKEATGDLARMSHTRFLTSPEFQIFSGDDDKTLEMMCSNQIRACGVISVVSNIAPAAVQVMCTAALRGDFNSAVAMYEKLAPLFNIVTVLADRKVGNSSAVTDKFRNPLPIKTAMNALGMPAGPCRQPLGKMTPAGAQKVREALTEVWRKSPEVLLPIQGFFDVNIEQRLSDETLWRVLCY
ncbi:MAG: 4-hydroxy-tetrahydrodipicolinate synthase [Candidatus Staskawiczbacteria bacterium]|nr:4-hydroxy-tetrahydrodipicolinate synthase [Candidatus Staskawiczbacteria bacterium]